MLIRLVSKLKLEIGSLAFGTMSIGLVPKPIFSLSHLNFTFGTMLNELVPKLSNKEFDSSIPFGTMSKVPKHQQIDS